MTEGFMTDKEILELAKTLKTSNERHMVKNYISDQIRDIEIQILDKMTSESNDLVYSKHDVQRIHRQILIDLQTMPEAIIQSIDNVVVADHKHLV